MNEVHTHKKGALFIVGLFIILIAFGMGWVLFDAWSGARPQPATSKTTQKKIDSNPGKVSSEIVDDLQITKIAPASTAGWNKFSHPEYKYSFLYPKTMYLVGGYAKSAGKDYVISSNPVNRVKYFTTQVLHQAYMPEKVYFSDPDTKDDNGARIRVTVGDNGGSGYLPLTTCTGNGYVNDMRVVEEKPFGPGLRCLAFTSYSQNKRGYEYVFNTDTYHFSITLELGQNNTIEKNVSAIADFKALTESIKLP